MSLILRRFHSTAEGVSASTRLIANDLLAKADKKPPLKRKQLLDANQIQLLSLTLNRPKLYSARSVHEEPPVNGTPVPPGYHLAYFTPAALSTELGKDGTDTSYNPDKPFTRRMWAGGELTWKKENPLLVGDSVTETTELLSAEPKFTRNGEEMIVVGVQKTFENAKGTALIDKRNWVFRTQLSKPLPVRDAVPRDITVPEPSNAAIKTRDFNQTAVTLFRFSALTFNAHQIHYSQPWCREVEGHRDIVVHGPLSLINMLDFWRDTRSGGDHELPTTIRYRATAPFYAGERYRALLEEGEDGTTQIKMWGSDGMGEVRVGMMGDVVT